jgi:hypothetical protein
MAKAPQPEDSSSRSAIGKDDDVSATGQDAETDEQAAAEDTTMTQDIAAQLKALKEQMQSLQASVAERSTKGAKAVARNVGTAGEKVTSTVETYPISAVLITAAAAFLLGRLSVGAVEPPAGKVEQLRHRLQELASRLPPNVRDRLRSSLH